MRMHSILYIHFMADPQAFIFFNQIVVSMKILLFYTFICSFYMMIISLKALKSQLIQYKQPSFSILYFIFKHKRISLRRNYHRNFDSSVELTT